MDSSALATKTAAEKVLPFWYEPEDGEMVRVAACDFNPANKKIKEKQKIIEFLKIIFNFVELVFSSCISS